MSSVESTKGPYGALGWGMVTVAKTQQEQYTCLLSAPGA